MKLASLLMLLGFLLGTGLSWLFLKRKIHRLQRFRRDFIANLSHEVRTPLAVIRGYAETLSGDQNFDAATRESFLKFIEDHSKRLIELIENLLALTRLEEVGPQRRTTLVHLPSFLGKLEERFRLHLGQKDLKWRIQIRQPVENLEMDEGLLRLILGNLIDNAIKYSARGGFVEVVAERRKNKIQIHVADQGCGIPRQEQQRIFERFYRGPEAHQRNIEGSGLGLAIAKHAAGALRGKLTIESRVGHGSRFSLTFPQP